MGARINQWLSSLHRFATAVIVAVALCVNAMAAVDIDGGDKELQGNVLAHLDSLVREPCDAPAWRITSYRRHMDKAVTEAAQALGYYHLQYQQTWSQDDCWQLTLQLTPGPRVTLSGVDYQLLGPGLTDSALAKLFDKLPLVSGQALNHQYYDDAITVLLRRVRNKGYWQASWKTHQLQVDRATSKAQIQLHLDSGPLFTLSELAVSPVPLDSGVLARLIDLPMGERYDKEQLDRSQKRLQDSGYFSSVWLQINVEEDAKDDLELPIKAELKMASQYDLSVGAGYSTDQGARVRAGVNNRYANQYGHSWSLNSLWSETIGEAYASYKIPLHDPADQWLDNQLGYRREETSSYSDETYSTGVRYVEQLLHNWQWFGALNWQRDRYRLGDESEPENTSKLLIPSIGTSFVVLDELSRPRKGIRLEGELLVSREELFSDSEFAQLRLSGKTILPLWSTARFIARGQIGETDTTSFDDLPPSIRFYAGGENSVRGYDYNSIGEKDGEDDIEGGSSLLVGSVELDQKITGQWSGAVFFDIGSAYDNKPDFKRGVGLGVRWHSPVGPLRVDFAHPLDGDKDYAFHLSLGADL